MKKKVIVACGGAIATSSFVADRVKKLCRAEGIDAEIVQCRLAEIPSNIIGASLVIPTSMVRRDYGIPMVVGMPLLSGIGEEETIEEILNILRG